MSHPYDTRNPLLIPKKEAPAKRVCPKCHGEDFGGRKVMGLVTYTCRNPECKNKWQGGGLGQEPMDPKIPKPHEPPPYVDFVKNPKTQEVVEVRKPVSLTQSFRKGLPEPKGDE